MSLTPMLGGAVGQLNRSTRLLALRLAEHYQYFNHARGTDAVALERFANDRSWNELRWCFLRVTANTGSDKKVAGANGATFERHLDRHPAR